MRIVTLAIAVGLLASSAQAYVYSYPVSIALNGQSGEETEVIGSGPNPPIDLVGIAAADSSPNVFGNTPYADVGSIMTADFESFSPPPFGVVIEAPQIGGIAAAAAALFPGDVVGPDSTWGSSGCVGGYVFAPTLIQLGDPAFLDGPNGAYVGIEFSDGNNQIHYGWLQVYYDEPTGSLFGTIDVTEAAYETTPGVPITITPEPTYGVVGILAAFGIIAPRRRSRSGRQI